MDQRINVLRTRDSDLVWNQAEETCYVRRLWPLFLLTSALVLFKAIVSHLLEKKASSSTGCFLERAEQTGRRVQRLRNLLIPLNSCWQTDWEKTRKWNPGQMFLSSLLLFNLFFLFGQMWRFLRTGHHRIRLWGCIKRMPVGLAAGFSSNCSVQSRHHSDVWTGLLRFPSRVLQPLRS